MRFLGLDSSTQSLTALVVDTETGEVIDRSVAFGARLPQYKSPNGFLAHADPRVKHSDPLMWVEALDLLLGELRAAGVDLGAIRGVSGAGQQHGSVYLARPLDEAGQWSASEPLVDQVRPLLSRATAPIWMDASTGAECAEIAAAAGGDDKMVAADRLASRSNASPDRRSASSRRTTPPATSAPPRSTWSARSWRRC